MIRPVIVLRPEPGNRATVRRVQDAGLIARSLPLFEIAPLVWSPPDPARFDQLLLTSANALRHGGAGLAQLTALPVLAVGEATARAARAAGFTVARTGDSDAAGLLADVAPATRLLWLCGRERTAIAHRALSLAVSVYAADLRPLDSVAAGALNGSIALLHSARAGAALAALADRHALPRAAVRVAAISTQAAVAAGPGWARIGIAAAPSDPALIDVAHTLAIDP